jgi:spore germination cell wall hydrolase CwlJ-like protein
LLIKPQARENVRALVGAAALGSTVGLAIGGAYLAGGLARATVVHAQIQRLAGAASGGFSDTALASAASGQDQAVLAIAKAHDPLAAATDDLRDRQVAALVDRLEARRAVRSDSAVGIQPLAVAQNQKAPVQKSAQPERSMVMKASLIQPKTTAAAEPFHLRGALDQSRDLECLTQAVYYEARGESRAGQQAVAQVILNRVRHPAFPKSICGVVFQGARTGGCQFSFACDGQAHHPVENAAWRRSEKVASDALDGQVMTEVGDATHFHVAGAGSGWNRLLKVAQIGAHVFYRFAGSAGSSAMFHRDAEPSPSVQTHPVFASLGLGAGSSAEASKLIESASAAVHRAATTLENAAKIGPSDPKPQPSVETKPQAAPAPAAPPGDDGSKSAASTPAS